ncbi:hypothetical protein B0H14DRAFT_1501728 [Mycena olivaceomarginata]|nr:hypothetical protein B0H14DRAFT_1501728 [Mycena olivaceomarginata]
MRRPPVRWGVTTRCAHDPRVGEPKQSLRHRHGRYVGPRWPPPRSRTSPWACVGLASGVLQQGYAVGYLIAAVISRELVPTVNVGWHTLSWTASGISIFGAVLRALLPKSSMFMKLCTAHSCRASSPSLGMHIRPAVASAQAACMSAIRGRNTAQTFLFSPWLRGQPPACPIGEPSTPGRIWGHGRVYR